MFNTTYYNALQHAHPGVVRVFLFLFLRISQSSTRKTHSTSFTVQCIQLNPEKKKETSERCDWSLPCFYIVSCEYPGPLFRNSEDFTEVLRLLRGIDVPVSDVSECTNQGVGYPRTFTARHEVEDPTVPSTAPIDSS